MNLRVLDILEALELFATANPAPYRPLAQHGTAWFRLLAAYDQWDFRLLALLEGDALRAWLPFCVRRSGIGTVMMSNPLSASYAGVMHDAAYPAPEAYRAMLRAYMDYGEEIRADLAVILTSPFRDDLPLYDAHFRPDYRLVKFYQYLTTDDPQERFGDSRFRNNLARNLNRAQKAGIRVSFTGQPAVTLVSEWYRTILTPRMNEIGASPLPEKFLIRLCESLTDSGLMSFASVFQNDTLLGGGFTLFGWCQDIFLRACTREAMGLGAGMLLDDALIREGLRRGVHAINFQSSPSRDSASYAYKRQWGCREGETAYLVRVLGSVAPFLQAGPEAVAAEFPGMFVLPHAAYKG